MVDAMNLIAIKRGEISLHFDVPEHSLPLNQFINSAQALKNIVEDFNEYFFMMIYHSIYMCLYLKKVVFLKGFGLLQNQVV